ncbi:MAG: response regulator transcription factor [Deltaproteobacteria bacterium]|nr:response regulator transcription factor [Candidatus Anaeroferrophillus wilburensis]MBN2889994.1 response regulator transcription factor [Deltaproteobacteria bacterium]
MRILIVDDEPQLVEQLRQSLTGQQYHVDTAGDGEEALDRLFDNAYDLILLDIMLPKRDGFEVLKELRQAEIKTPVLMLTARGEIGERVCGLDLGADDYLAKPFSLAELMARIRALLRRSSDHSQPVLTVAEIILNTISREVRNQDHEVPLTPKEFSILEFLLYNKNRVVSRFSIAEHVWGDDFDPFTMSNYIDVHIKNLRRKLDDLNGTIIQTVRGVGYVIKGDKG